MAYGEREEKQIPKAVSGSSGANECAILAAVELVPANHIPGRGLLLGSGMLIPVLDD